MADLGRARYSAENTHHVLYLKAGASRLSNMILRGMSGESTGPSSGACLGHHLGHVLGIVWGIVWGMSGAV